MVRKGQNGRLKARMKEGGQLTERAGKIRKASSVQKIREPVRLGVSRAEAAPQS